MRNKCSFRSAMMLAFNVDWVSDSLCKTCAQRHMKFALQGLAEAQELQSMWQSSTLLAPMAKA